MTTSIMQRVAGSAAVILALLPSLAFAQYYPSSSYYQNPTSYNNSYSYPYSTYGTSYTQPSYGSSYQNPYGMYGNSYTQPSYGNYSNYSPSYNSYQYAQPYSQPIYISNYTAPYTYIGQYQSQQQAQYQSQYQNQYQYQPSSASNSSYGANPMMNNYSSPQSYSSPTGTHDAFGTPMCNWSDYRGAAEPCGTDPQQWVFDPYTSTWY